MKEQSIAAHLAAHHGFSGVDGGDPYEAAAANAALAAAEEADSRLRELADAIAGQPPERSDRAAEHATDAILALIPTGGTMPELHPIDQQWREFAEQADAVAERADALLVMARQIGNPSAIKRARDLRDGALDLWNTYKDAGKDAVDPGDLAALLEGDQS